MNMMWTAANASVLWGKALSFGVVAGAASAFVAGVLALFAMPTTEGAVAVAVAVGVGMCLFGMYYVVRNERQRGQAFEQKQAAQWIAAARTDEERQRRQKVWETGGWAAVALALAAAAGVRTKQDSDDDSGPMVNVDGTPMFGMTDANGNPFGVTYNSAADSFTPSAGSYESPIGEDRY
jgi:hypothetical protein